VSLLLRSFFALVCVLAFGLLSVNASAADADTGNSRDHAPIVINLKQLKVVKDEKGDQQFVDAALVLPGDVIEYRATYANRGKAALPVVATMPIPESMEYIKDSAKAKDGIAHTVALKDAQFSTEPLQRKVATASGATLSQPLPYSSYRYVRWDLGRLLPGSSIEVSVRAKVSQNLDVDANAGDRAPALASVIQKQ
jgi:uncharacterized repeat protein (TIGR01451 family)